MPEIPNNTSEDIFDGHASRYSATIDESLKYYGVNHDFFNRHKALLIKRLLNDRGKETEAMDFLDVGCGIGNIHALIGPQFRTVTGVDVSSGSIAEAQARFPAYRYIDYDGRKLPIRAESVDFVTAICVLHHIPPQDWLVTVQEMLRVLRPNGIALVIEHNPLNPLTRRIVSSCPIDIDAILLRRRQTVNLFREAGASSVCARSILSVPPVGRALLKLDAWLGPLPFGAQYYCLATARG